MLCNQNPCPRTFVFFSHSYSFSTFFFSIFVFFAVEGEHDHHDIFGGSSADGLRDGPRPGSEHDNGGGTHPPDEASPCNAVFIVNRSTATILGIYICVRRSCESTDRVVKCSAIIFVLAVTVALACCSSSVIETTNTPFTPFSPPLLCSCSIFCFLLFLVSALF